MSSSAILELKNIVFSYTKGSPLIDHASLTIAPGSRLSLTGDNGCGKSTILHLATGLVKASSGHVIFREKELKTEKDFQKARPFMGYLLQHSCDQLFCATVIEDVAFGPLNLGKSVDEAREIALKTLDTLGIAHLADRFGHNISGGETKLAALATVLSLAPDFLLLDEPTNDLDSKARAHLIETLLSLNLPFLAVSHDLEFLNASCNTFLTLENGKIRG